MERWENLINENIKTSGGFEIDDFNLDDLKGTCKSFGVIDYTLEELTAAIRDNVTVKGNCTLEVDNLNNSTHTETEIYSITIKIQNTEVDIYDLVDSREDLLYRVQDWLWDACNEQNNQ